MEAHLLHLKNVSTYKSSRVLTEGNQWVPTLSQHKYPRHLYILFYKNPCVLMQEVTLASVS
jgi:hypothetical protein